MAFAINDFFPCNLIENDTFLEIHNTVSYRNTESTECDLPVSDIADKI